MPKTHKDPRRFTFGLPRGDTSVNAGPGLVYAPLSRGKCDTAQRAFDGYRDPDFGLGDPALFDLFATAIALCRGDLTEARKTFHLELGTEDEVWFLCELRRAVASVIHQEPRDRFGSCKPVNPLDDADGDGVPDYEDADPDDATVTDVIPLDQDGDGIPDDEDPNPVQASNLEGETDPNATATSKPTVTPTGTTEPTATPS